MKKNKKNYCRQHVGGIENQMWTTNNRDNDIEPLITLDSCSENSDKTTTWCLALKIQVIFSDVTHTHTHTPVSYTHLDVYKRQGFQFLKDKFSNISDAKFKVGIFVGPQIRKLGWSWIQRKIE